MPCRKPKLKATARELASVSGAPLTSARP
jgi:hypothetical protein